MFNEKLQVTNDEYNTMLNGKLQVTDGSGLIQVYRKEVEDRLALLGMLMFIQIIII